MRLLLQRDYVVATSPARRVDTGTGALATLTWGCVWLVAAALFGALALHAATGNVSHYDLRLLDAAQHLPSFLQPLFRLEDALGQPHVLIAALGALLALLLLRGAWLEAAVTLTSPLPFAVEVAVKHVVREYPPGLGRAAHHTGAFASNFAFPSGHALGYAVIAGLLWAFAERLTRDATLAELLRAFCVIAVVTVGPGRVYLRDHYASDVIAGYALAALFLIPALLVYNRMRR